MITYATRFHDFSCGHRVVGHESHCAHLHGHNYRVHFTVEGKLDSVGRVLDFSVIKSKLCQWLEDNWDHRFLYWSEDTVINNTFSAMFDFRENARRALDRLDHRPVGQGPVVHPADPDDGLVAAAGGAGR